NTVFEFIGVFLHNFKHIPSPPGGSNKTVTGNDNYPDTGGFFIPNHFMIKFFFLTMVSKHS
ncbi:MAG TPA: hypothetical protein VJ879_09670, partial [Desulfobacter sp.]|nr:hypothetical protein [Desulfobacter sp.]